jgi:hypothetical protein
MLKVILQELVAIIISAIFIGFSLWEVIQWSVMP